MSKPLVYVLDDDVELSKVLERRFVSYGCDCRAFSDSASLFMAISEKKPQLLLLDLHLGEGQSGFDVIKKTRAEQGSDLPILILSGDRDQSNIAHALELGANDYIAKPPLRLEFEEIVSQYIQAEKLAEHAQGAFRSVHPEKNAAKLAFRVAIEEVGPTSLTLLSDHLIKKGVSFYLNGPELKSIIPQAEKVFVTVTSSATKVVADAKLYQIQVEIDSSQEEALEQVRGFLNSKSAERAPT